MCSIAALPAFSFPCPSLLLFLTPFPFLSRSLLLLPSLHLSSLSGNWPTTASDISDVILTAQNRK